MQYDEILGQSEIKNALIQGVETKRFAHAYLFEGPEGIGKKKMAKVFAQALLCKSKDARPCDHCSSCRKANTANHPDILQIDLEGSIKKEVMDEIVFKVHTKPYESPVKIICIYQAQNLTLQGANTFLKTLEEPPASTVMILTVTNRDLLLPTIVSRCQVLAFEKDKEDFIIAKLKSEGATDSQIQIILGYSKNIAERAMSIFRGELPVIDLRQKIIEMMDHLIQNDLSAPYAYEVFFDENQNRIGLVIELIMIWFRDILYTQIGESAQLINKDQQAILNKHTKKISRKKCMDIQQYLQKSYEEMLTNANYKVAIDHLLFKIQEVKVD